MGPTPYVPNMRSVKSCELARPLITFDSLYKKMLRGHDFSKLMPGLSWRTYHCKEDTSPYLDLNRVT